MDTLEITGLTVNTTIGIHDWEKLIKQKLLIDIKIPTSFANCEDNINNTLDYDKISQAITTFVEENPFNLIETVAEKIALIIKNEFGVEEINVKVYKPNSIKNAANVCVNITR